LKSNDKKKRDIIKLLKKSSCMGSNVSERSGLYIENNHLDIDNPKPITNEDIGTVRKEISKFD